MWLIKQIVSLEYTSSSYEVHLPNKHWGII